MLLALARVHRHQLVRQAGFFKEKCHLQGVG